MNIKKECITAAEELIEKAQLKKGDIVVIGCSTSEVLGSKIGSNSSPDTAKILFESLWEVFSKNGIYLAAQCCEHLNRAIIIEKAAVADLLRLNFLHRKYTGTIPLATVITCIISNVNG